MADIQVLFLGQDLYKLGYVKSLPAISEKKTFKRDKIGTNSFNLICKNIDNFFSNGNENSILTGADWLYSSLVIINEDGITTWNGIAIDIVQDQNNKEVTIKSNDVIFSKRNDIIEYTSSDWETPADAARNIMDSVGFESYNNRSLQDSIDQLAEAGMYIKCNFLKSQNVSLIKALEDLGVKSCSDVFSHYGNLYFKHYQPFVGGVSLNLNVSRSTSIKTKPIITSLEPEMINQYNIDYNHSGETPLTDTDNIGQLSRSKYGVKSLSTFVTGDDKQIVIKDIISARYIGECYIYMTQKSASTKPQPKDKIQFDVDIKYKEYIDLESYFKLTLKDNNWIGKIFEVYEFVRNEKNKNINIVGYEV